MKCGVLGVGGGEYKTMYEKLRKEKAQKAEAEKQKNKEDFTKDHIGASSNKDDEERDPEEKSFQRYLDARRQQQASKVQGKEGKS